MRWVWYSQLVFLLFNDFHSPRSLVSPLPCLHSSPARLNLCCCGHKKKKWNNLHAPNHTLLQIRVMYQPPSVFGTRPLPCSLCIWPVVWLLKCKETFIECANCRSLDYMMYIIGFALTQLMFAFFKSILCGIQGSWMADEYFCSNEIKKLWNTFTLNFNSQGIVG